MQVTLTFEPNTIQAAHILERILEILGGNLAKDDPEPMAPSSSAMGEELALRLRGRTEQMVRFAVEHGGQVWNDELAAVLGFSGHPAKTAAILGEVTVQLRNVGVGTGRQRGGDADAPWYQKLRSDGRTLLRIRPDVLGVFQGAVAAKQ